MSDIPEHLLRRSAEAKAKALGIPVEQVLAEMKGETPPTPMATSEQPSVETVSATDAPASDDAAPAAEAAPAPEPAAAPAAEGGAIDYEAAAAKAGMPASLLQRSVEAKAKASGTSEAAVLAEMLGEEAPAAAAPAAEPEPESAPAPEPAAAPAAEGGAIDYEAAAAKAGMPASLLQRSVEAKAKASGTSEAAVLAGMLGEEAPTAPEPAAAPEPATEPEPAVEAAPAAEPVPAVAVAPVEESAPVEVPAASTDAGGGSGRLATAVSPRPVAQPEAIPEGVRTQRLLTVVKASAIQQVKPEPTDKVNTWPHLMIAEFAALMAVTAVLIVLSVILQAPLLESANFNATPNPSKAPWYFLGLQELLSYFDPQIAGVTVPTIIGLVGFMAIPYVDKNPSNKPSDRKFAIFMYTFFIMGSAVLTILGVLFRGPGFNFTYPWADGIWFDDLKDWVNFE